jgi:hypothetical protein
MPQCSTHGCPTLGVSWRRQLRNKGINRFAEKTSMENRGWGGFQEGTQSDPTGGLRFELLEMWWDVGT